VRIEQRLPTKQVQNPNMSLKKFLGLGKSGEAEDSVAPPESPIDPIAPEDPVLKSSEEVVEEVQDSEQTVLEDKQTALEDTFTSVNIPFVANAPDYTSKLYGANARGYSGSTTLGYSNYSSGYSGATTRGYSTYSGATTRGYSGATTSGYSRGYSSPTSVTIPFKANTASYRAPSTTVASSGFSSYSANARGYSSGYSSGFSSGFSSPKSVTIPFKANTPSFSAPLSTSVASSYATPATSYATPMTAPAPVALGGSGAAANFYQNYSKERDMKLRQTIDNNLTLHA
jgi:hypothetical protein